MSNTPNPGLAIKRGYGIGVVFGCLTVINPISLGQIRVRCTCGHEVVIKASHLKPNRRQCVRAICTNPRDWQPSQPTPPGNASDNDIFATWMTGAHCRAIQSKHRTAYRRVKRIVVKRTGMAWPLAKAIRSGHFVGRKFGHLTTSAIRQSGRSFVIDLDCECGESITVPPEKLTNPRTYCSGTCALKSTDQQVDLTGKVYGRLTVSCRDPGLKRYWICKCQCGDSCSVHASNLRANRQRSCGCFRRQCDQQKSGVPRFLDSNGDIVPLERDRRPGGSVGRSGRISEKEGVKGFGEAAKGSPVRHPARAGFLGGGGQGRRERGKEHQRSPHVAHGPVPHEPRPAPPPHGNEATPMSEYNRNATTFDIILIMLAFLLVDWLLPETTTAGKVGATFILWRAADITVRWADALGGIGHQDST